MKKVLMLLSLILLLSSGCARSNSIQSSDYESPTPTGTPVGTNNPRLETASCSTIIRVSDTEDKNGFFIRPYTSASITFTLSRKLNENEKVTVVPINTDSESFAAAINAVEENSEEIGGGKRLTWFTCSIEDIKVESILTGTPVSGRRDDTPFDAIILYPALNDAKLLDPQSNNYENLVDEKADNLLAAIDTDADGQADILVYRENTDYTLTRYYIRDSDGFILLKGDSPL